MRRTATTAASATRIYMLTSLETSPARLASTRARSARHRRSVGTMNVGQREEHLVRARIDRHGVGAVRQERPAKLIQRAAPPAEDSNDAALGRHVEPAQTGIKGEHVGLVADREARRHPPRS